MVNEQAELETFEETSSAGRGADDWTFNARARTAGPRAPHSNNARVRSGGNSRTDALLCELEEVRAAARASHVHRPPGRSALARPNVEPPSRWSHSNPYDWTLDCLDHDACSLKCGSTTAALDANCADEWGHASDDFSHFWKRCYG